MIIILVNRNYLRDCYCFPLVQVKYWVTVNEPSVLCQYGYGSDTMIPALNLSGKADYICGHNLLLAHAGIYEVYQKKYYDKQNGETVKINSLSIYLEYVFLAVRFDVFFDVCLSSILVIRVNTLITLK